MKKITVFTPTYNRIYILPKLYNSLVNQTNKDFVWLIVDDGSTDNTKQIVNEWIAEGKIEIKYIYQQNGGKMKAHNLGVEKTDTPYFVCVDSDDYVTDSAIENILNQCDNIENQNICGIVAYRGDAQGKIISTPFPEGEKVVNFSNMYEDGFSGDTVFVFKSQVIKKYPFPIIANEKFITEAYVYEQISIDYQVLLLNEVIVICEYNTDGLTKNLQKVIFNNPCGYVAYFLQKGNFASSRIQVFKAYIRANAFRKFTKGVQMPVYAKKKFLYFISRPFGIALYLKKKREYQKSLKIETK